MTPLYKNLSPSKGVAREWLPTLQRNQAFTAVTTETHLWTNFNLMEVFDQFSVVCNRYPFNSQARKNGPTHTLSDITVPVSRTAACSDDRCYK